MNAARETYRKIAANIVRIMHGQEPPALDANERKTLSEKVKSALTELSRK